MSDKIKDVKLSYQCPLSWDSLRTVEGGKYCDSCKHVVHDFTNARPCELKALLESNERVCGRFTRSQMSANFLTYAAATVIAASGAAANACMENEETKPGLPGKTYLEVQFPPVQEEEFVTMGIVFYDPDSTNRIEVIEEDPGDTENPEATE